MGGCCEANKVLKYNTRTELITRYNNPNQEETREIEKKHNIFKSNNNNNFDMNFPKNENENDLENSHHKDYDTEIPQIKEVKMPSMKIPIDIIQTKKQLELKIFESKYLPEGRTMSINPGGLVGSERNEQDGITIFGVANSEFINDFNFPEEESNIGKRHFEIKYDISSDEYKIKNLTGSGLYIQITDKILLRNNSIFSFSSILISTKISFESSEDNFNNDYVNNYSIISLKVIYGINQGLEMSFDSRQKQVIRLGRIKNFDIDIDFPDESISRYQTIIFFQNNNWYITDGDGEKRSLNGTWFLAEEYVTINEGMIFRAGSTSFQAHLFTP